MMMLKKSIEKVAAFKPFTYFLQPIAICSSGGYRHIWQRRLLDALFLTHRNLVNFTRSQRTWQHSRCSSVCIYKGEGMPILDILQSFLYIPAWALGTQK